MSPRFDLDPSADAAPPLRGGRYRLLQVLGEGGMAIVYRGVDTRLEVERAVKLLLPQMAARPRIRARFDAEARTMARLTHPHIVAIQDVDADEDRVFLVMELLRGGTLWDWTERHGPMPARLAVDAMLPVLDALGFAHQAGVVHRDVKPQNVLLTRDGVPKLTDFGIARIETEDSRTRTAAVMGTWTYMPPEQRKSAKETDARADIYAVGAMIHALVKGEDPPDLFAADLDEGLLSDLPPALARVVRTATRYQREERYPDAVTMGQALLACRDELPPVPPSLAALGPVHVGTGVPLTRGMTAGVSAGTVQPVVTAPTAPPRSAPPRSVPPASSPPRSAPSTPSTSPATVTSAPLTAVPAGATFPAELELGLHEPGLPEPGLPSAAPPPPPPSTSPGPSSAPLRAGQVDGTMVPPGEGTFANEGADLAASTAAPARGGRRGMLALFALVLAAGVGTAAWWRLAGGPASTEAPAAEAPAAETPAAEPPAAEAAPLVDPTVDPDGEATLGTAVEAAAPGEAAPAPAPTARNQGSVAATAAATAAGSAAAPPAAPASPALGESTPTAAEIFIVETSPPVIVEDPPPAAPAAATPTAPTPAAATTPTASTSGGPPGRVSVTGQVTGATLVEKTSGRRYSPGEVPVGDYWLEVRFFGTDEVVRPTSVRVISNFALTVRCQSRTRTCH